MQPPHTSQSSTFENEPTEEVLSLAARAGTCAGGGVIAAVVASLPAALRVGSGGAVRAFEQWLGLAALLTPFAIVLVAIFRRGRAGATILFGDRTPLVMAGALWWAVLQLALLSVVGAVLRAKTHHHGLAGVTFALFALFSGIVIALLAARGGRMVARIPLAGGRAHRVALTVVTLTSFVVIVLVGWRTARADGLHTAAALVDMVALLVAAAVASARAVARWRALAVSGLPLTVAVLILGLVTALSAPDLSRLLAAGAPVQAWLLERLGR